MLLFNMSINLNTATNKNNQDLCNVEMFAEYFHLDKGVSWAPLDHT
jgi:hypothetical protein